MGCPALEELPLLPVRPSTVAAANLVAVCLGLQVARHQLGDVTTPTLAECVMEALEVEGWLSQGLPSPK
jgi:hypothetical protein